MVWFLQRCSTTTRCSLHFDERRAFHAQCQCNVIGIDTCPLGKSLKLVARLGDCGRQDWKILAPRVNCNNWFQSLSKLDSAQYLTRTNDLGSPGTWSLPSINRQPPGFPELPSLVDENRGRGQPALPKVRAMCWTRDADESSHHPALHSTRIPITKKIRRSTVGPAAIPAAHPWIRRVTRWSPKF